MNVRPGDPIEPAMLKHIAATMRLWSDQALPVARKGKGPPHALHLAAWELGDVRFLFAAAELFAETARIRHRDRSLSGIGPAGG